MKQVVRVQTLYSFKKKDGSLLPRGTYSVDTPGGIPQLIVDEAMRGSTTVKVLEWREVSEPADKAKVEEPLAEEETSEEIDSEEEEPEEVTEKPKTARRKRK